MRQIILLFFLITGITTTVFANEVYVLDDFNDGNMVNNFGGSGGGFDSLPATGTCIAKVYNANPENIRGKNNFSLQLTYDVSNSESFSGYFSKLEGNNLSNLKYLSFWVKGGTGGELFKIELKNNGTDTNRNKAAVYVTDYLDGGVTTEWQKVVIPLDAFVNIDDWTNMKEFVIVFENYQGSVNGSPLNSTIYIDDILFGSYFIGCMRIDHYGDRLGINALGGNMGNMDSGGGSKTYSIATSTYHNAPNSLLSEYDVTNGWAGVFKIFGGGKDGWTAIPHNFSAYDNLSLWVKAKSDAENPKEMKIEFKDPNTKYVRINVTSEWQKISRSLTTFGVDKTNISSMDYIYEDWRVENKIGGVYIDEVQFEKAGYAPDTISPITPTNLKNNGEPIVNGYIFGMKNILTVNADSGATDETLEGVRFEYSDDGENTWHTIGTDYDLSDSIYETTWYISGLRLDKEYSIRAVAQDVAENETPSTAYHNCKIEIKGGLNYTFDNFNDQNIYFNNFCGNWGELNGENIESTFSTTVYYGTTGASLKIAYNLPEYGSYTGIWESVFGHSDYPEYYLNFNDIYGSLEEGEKGFDLIILWVKGSGMSNNQHIIKLELKDNRSKDERYNYTAYRYISIDDKDTEWKPIVLDANVTNSKFWSYNQHPPDPAKMKEMVFIIESAYNGTSGSFYIDNISFVDEDDSPFVLNAHSDDEFLEFIAKRTFKYFLDWAEPESGLILDRSTFPDLISISATGFGLTALCIGAERGWISKTDAYNKTLKIIKTCNNIIEKQSSDPNNYGKWGFFYHFLDPGTCPKRKGDSELSTIDTALLVYGALTAGEYFGLEVKTEADKLYKGVQWDKFLYTKERADNKGWQWYGTYSNQFFSAWKPGDEYPTSPYVDEGGRFSNRSFDRPNEPFTWDYYTDEIILLCLLGIDSPTYPVGTNTFYAWHREQGTYSSYSLIQSHPGSLFTYFFAHCWLKLKDLGVDNHPVIPINWWENSVNAALANWKYCKDKNYEGWGLTACEGPDGNYYAYGAPPSAELKDDGTLAPYGAGSSIAFLPIESISTLKHYFQNTDLWRYLFGFGDAYNSVNATVTTHYNGSWYNHSYFGIDQGPMLIMIENYRSGLIWKYVMQNGYIQKALLTIFPAAKPEVIITKKARNITQRGVGNEYFNPEGTAEGNIIEFKILVENTGLGTATGVIVTDKVPDGLIYTGVITGKGADDSQKPNLRWNIGTMASNSSEVLTFQAKVSQYYSRECEYPDEYTVGTVIWRSNASGSKVHGQFGCEGSPWPGKAGYVKYKNINLRRTEHLYLILRYSKYSGSGVPIRIYLDEETTPRVSFYPVNQGNWDSFTDTATIDLGSVTTGIHSIKFETDGQQYGVADLDKFTIF